MSGAADRERLQSTTARRSWRARLTWRGLGIVWAVTITALGSGAALLQWSGPMRRPPGLAAQAPSSASTPAPETAAKCPGPEPARPSCTHEADAVSAPSSSGTAQPVLSDMQRPQSEASPPGTGETRSAQPEDPQAGPPQPALSQPGPQSAPREPPPVLHPSGGSPDLAAATGKPALADQASTTRPAAPSPTVLPVPASSPGLLLPPASGAEPVIAQPNTGLLEPIPGGLTLPRIGPDGLAPAELYARPFAAPPGVPVIAILVDGIGLSESDSEAAIDLLPGPIDLAISPYAPHPDALLQRARAKGHEFLASIPMEPAGAPLNDEGARALTADVAPDINRTNLEAVLGRIQGYVGATGASDGQKGEHFAQSGRPFALLAKELADRGLLYVNPRVVALSVRLPSRTVDSVLDDPTSLAAIDAKLARLEAVARENGSALGLAGPPRPVVLDHLASWARSLAVKGIVLAPVSALVSPAPGTVFPTGPHATATDPAEPTPVRKAP